MFDNYFAQYEKLILPIKHSSNPPNPTPYPNTHHKKPSSANNNHHSKPSNTQLTNHLSNTIKPKSKANTTLTNITCLTPSLSTSLLHHPPTNLNLNEDSKSSIDLKEKKSIMFLRQENAALKSKVLVLESSLISLNNTIEFNERSKAKDNDYMLRLEKLVMYLKEDIAKYKASAHNKSLGNITATAIVNQDDSTNASSCLFPCNTGNNLQDVLLKKLEAENKKLLIFKEEVYQLSKTYDTINEIIVNVVVDIGRIYKELNGKYLRRDMGKEEIDYEIEMAYCKQGKKAIDQMMLEMVHYMQSKQDEYNYLLNEKDGDILILREKIKEVIEEKASSMNALTEKNKVIEDLKGKLMLSGKNSITTNSNSAYRKCNRLIRSQSASMLKVHA